jgi:hypothetical protein
MPVLPYHNQKEPAEEAVIWRFLNLRKFRDFMANEELYFCRADLFSDKTEGLPPEQYVRRILRLDPLDIHDQVKLNDHLGVLAQDREMFFISCWHLYRKEELDLWEQYGPDGAAVCSRYGLLKTAMARLLDDAHLGSVQYGTDHLTDRFNILEFITTKQKKFETDCEVRAFLMAPNVLSGGNRHIDLDDFPHRLPLDMNPRHPWVPDGKRRRIILRDLVEDVVISPWAEPFEVEEIKLWTKLKTSGATRDSELRNRATPSLVEAGYLLDSGDRKILWLRTARFAWRHGTPSRLVARKASGALPTGAGDCRRSRGAARRPLGADKPPRAF